ncbi:MAG: hypothetical protein K0S04_3122, partial [Herbinix sp.]|nr:hypothetical protein [Herbinix sp.]
GMGLLLDNEFLEVTGYVVQNDSLC